MPWRTETREGVLQHDGEDRIVVIPRDFVLIGDKIIIQQEKDGTISIYPATKEGRKALDRFSPFGDWDKDDV